MRREHQQIPRCGCWVMFWVPPAPLCQHPRQEIRPYWGIIHPGGGSIFIFYAYFDDHIFQMGWNHQLVMMFFLGETERHLDVMLDSEGKVEKMTILVNYCVEDCLRHSSESFTPSYLNYRYVGFQYHRLLHGRNPGLCPSKESSCGFLQRHVFRRGELSHINSAGCWDVPLQPTKMIQVTSTQHNRYIHCTWYRHCCFASCVVFLSLSFQTRF